MVIGSGAFKKLDRISADLLIVHSRYYLVLIQCLYQKCLSVNLPIVIVSVLINYLIP